MKRNWSGWCATDIDELQVITLGRHFWQDGEQCAREVVHEHVVQTLATQEQHIDADGADGIWLAWLGASGNRGGTEEWVPSTQFVNSRSRHIEQHRTT
jgi:hypothetical protein